MNMIFICTYFYKIDLKPSTDSLTDILQGFLNNYGKYIPAIFRRKHYMIQKQAFIMTLYGMAVFHTIKLSFILRQPMPASGNSLD